MKQIFLAALLAFPLFCISQYTYNNLQVNFLETETAAKSYSYENLRLYPIKAKAGFKSQFAGVGKYVPLKEALEKKKVVITEKSNGETVSTLTVENVSNDTIIIIVGEVIKGGKQDRIINKDVVLPPKRGKKDLSVYCVESGRWTYNSPRSQNEFNSYFNVGSVSLRKTVEKEKSQGKVWSKVEEINNANKTKTETSTYTALTSSENFNKKLSAYKKFFKEKFVQEQDVIGVVVVSGDKVLGCDMFATADLFKQNFENLLSSYATEAIISGKTVTATAATVKKYMDKLLSSEKEQDATLKEKGNSFSNKGKKLRISSYD
ncbi:MAG: DUF6569 family protein [Chitinophagaceae bacterium]|nr:DUF6569 family protein [Chitinophagaceae bacterium]